MSKAVLSIILLIYASAVFSSHGVILLYHHISDQAPATTTTSRETFKRHIQYLAEHNFNVIPLTALVNALQTDKPLPNNTVCITFDDGYEDIFTYGVPILKSQNYPFTVFVATKFIGQRGYLNWQQLRMMQTQGMSIANHSHSHSHLLRRTKGKTEMAWQTRIKHEITYAQMLLEQRLGQTPKFLAYPYGEYDLEILEIVKQLGFVGFGQQSGAVDRTSNLLLLSRYPLSGVYGNLEMLKTKLQTQPMPVVNKPINPIITGSRAPQLKLEFLPGNYLWQQLACYGPNGVTRLKQVSKYTFLAENSVPNPIGRSRYNCTMPINGSQQFYWFSQLWIRQYDDGSWYAED